ncbi:PREDICTED: ataxin-10-like, partial [Priapulus caudatus]|uniref:Ataxin-10-like n=1 Tax=Priapulus caudatus TaxID=37621 RepID=A0ABM1EXG2_PRICU
MFKNKILLSSLEVNLFHKQSTADDVLQQMKDLTSLCKMPENRVNVQEEDYVAVKRIIIMSDACHVMHESQFPLELRLTSIATVTECFRTLRNLCADCLANQDSIRNNGTFAATRDIFVQLLVCNEGQDEGSGEHIREDLAETPAVNLAIRCAVQFLGNFVTANESNQELVWNELRPHFRTVLAGADLTAANYCCMLLLNMPSCRERILSDDSSRRLLDAVVLLVTRHEAEWGIFLLEKCVAEESFYSHTYPTLSAASKLAVLDLVSAQISSQDGSTESVVTDVPIECLRHVCEEFRNLCSCIIDSSSKRSVEPELMTRMLGVLCTATAQRGCYDALLDEPHLVACAVKLLQRVHAIETADDAKIAEERKTGDRKSADLDVRDDSAIYGFKRDLIRLLGNLCYRHRVNQDQ